MPSNSLHLKLQTKENNVRSTYKNKKKPAGEAVVLDLIFLHSLPEKLFYKNFIDQGLKKNPLIDIFSLNERSSTHA